VAFDRAVRDAEAFELDGPIEHWRHLRNEIHTDVCQHGYDPDLDAFVQAYGSKQLDASLLLLPVVGFLPPDDRRVRGTVAAIERHLMFDGFVHRYDSAVTADGLPPGEGAFLACSFWLVDAYVLQGRMEQARELFQRLLGLSNDVGLLAEGYDPGFGRLVGNFPQAFSHLALVQTAYNLTNASKPAEQRAERSRMPTRSQGRASVPTGSSPDVHAGS
jgi:GH15 family glucan-1,4-alpha-glucosidase